jgi:hypothetical protein
MKTVYTVINKITNCFTPQITSISPYIIIHLNLFKINIVFFYNIMKLGGSLGNVPQKYYQVPSPPSLSIMLKSVKLFYLNTIT